MLDPELFAVLKNLRKDVARQHNVPPYVVFQDSSLEQMATMYPTTLEELYTIIPGVGRGKAMRYGAKFCEVIKKHCAEHEIVRPEDLRIRTVAKNSRKIKIIQSIDSKMALDDIADSMNMDFEDFLTEVERIVYSGTKLDINYFLEEVMDDDVVDDIYAYFRESETDKLSVAMDELGGEYEEDEVRLVRIKFLSELAN